MPCIRSRKTSSGSLPYTASKPKPTTKKTITKKPAIKKPKVKSTTVAATTAATTAISQHQQALINDDVLQSVFVARESPLPATALGDLSNAILPVFRAANFPDVDDYEVIEPSVRLASHLLQHPSLQYMLRTILKHGKLIALGENDNKGEPLHRYPHNTRNMTAGDLTLIGKSLDELAEFVTFKENPKRSPEHATTVPIKKTKKSHRKENLAGLCSRIEYSPALLQTFTQAAEARVEDQDIPLLLTWRFTFAVQLAHEVCHALVFAKDGRRKELDTDPFFHRATVAETGFTMEETLFGGSPSLLWCDEEPTAEGAIRAYHKGEGELSDLVGLSVVWSLPCTWIVRDYQHHKCALWMREADMDALKPKDVAWRVSMENLARFFDTEFWAQANPPTLFDHTVGFGFSSNAKGEKYAAKFGKRELRDYAPGGYTISEHKAIIKR